MRILNMIMNEATFGMKNRNNEEERKAWVVDFVEKQGEGISTTETIRFKNSNNIVAKM